MSAPTSPYRGKRALDLAIASIALVVSSPLIALSALAVWLTLGRPVLFLHRRLGQHGIEFDVLKFRTMTDDCDASGELLPDEDRLGRVGRVLRSASLDELPQLWNVIRGEMSIVGPRPLLVSYRVRYTAEEARRMDVLPGITGLAQVSGRNATDWESRLALDVDYVQRCSLRFDLEIIARTIPAVLSRRGVSADGHATMPELRPDAASGADPKAGPGVAASSQAQPER